MNLLERDIYKKRGITIIVVEMWVFATVSILDACRKPTYNAFVKK